VEQALNDDSIGAETSEILPSLIDRVVTQASEAPDGLDALRRPRGHLALSSDKPHKQKLPAIGVAGSQLSVVAGVRNHLELLLRST
jgi:hypothetical protein